jgi:hypothetical protein
MDKFFLRDQWRRTIEGDGGHCPVCKRWGKINVVIVNELQALSLLWMSKATLDENGYINMQTTPPRFVLKSRSYHHLAKWGLIEKPQKDDDKTKKSDGFWRVTEKGFLFLNNQLRIPNKVFFYNKEVEGWGEQLIYFKDCFGKHFDYEEVISHTFNLNAIKIKD